MRAFTLLLLVMVTSPLVAQSYQAPTSREDFQLEFQRIFRSGDFEASLKLFFWRGVPGQSRRVIEGMIRRDLGLTLRRTAWFPPPDDDDASRRGDSLQTNLPVVSRFAAEFVDEQGRRFVSLHNIGIRDGVFFIALVKRIPLSA